MSKSWKLSKLAGIQKDIENLENTQKEIVNIYFTGLNIQLKVETDNFSEEFPDFSVELDEIVAEKVVAEMLKDKKNLYAMLLKELGLVSEPLNDNFFPKEIKPPLIRGNE